MLLRQVQHVTALLVHAAPEHISRHGGPSRVARFEGGPPHADHAYGLGWPTHFMRDAEVDLDVVVINGEIEEQRGNLSEELLATSLAREGLP
jgi:hypothetical protein